MTDKHRVPLVLIAGLSPDAGSDLAGRLRGDDRGTAVVHHDLRQIGSGVVLRRLRLGPRESLTTLELAHGCVSCTLREDLLPLLRTLARRPEVRRIVVHLDEAMEPEPVCWAVHHLIVGDRPVIDDVQIEAVVTAVDAGSWLADATGDDTMADRGLRAAADDERTVAQVALSQVEFADVLVLSGAAPDAWTAARTGAVLERVAPSVPILQASAVDTATLRSAVPAHARRGEPTDVHGALLRGEPPLHADCGVAVLPFFAQRPFHPQRLHEAIDVLLDGVVRTRGRAWVASQPDAAFWVESAGGGLGIGHAGAWLDSPGAPAWEDVSPERRTLASLRWHPRFGDRAQELVVVTHQAEPRDIEATLNAALLTDEELAAGPAAWTRYPDPFGEWHTDPCEDGELGGTHDVNASPGKEETE
ncbi:ribosome hibernation factor-recruiting GTPase MRF [Prauserella muralis]|uniref:ribosome hibernation factor-recruiting GTPase MRF n=1 Tax=Prauserella muralis TaxID=588067 RepID=UPI000DD3B087|nr:GTP-binding protein [Prauserella muralis]